MRMGEGSSYFLSKEDSNAKVSSKSLCWRAHAEVKVWKVKLRAVGFISGSHFKSQEFCGQNH